MKVVPFKDEYVCVCVCLREGEREMETETQKEREKDRERREGGGEEGRRKREGSQTLFEEWPCQPCWPGGKARHKGLILFVNEIWITSTIPSFSLKILLPCHFYFTLWGCWYPNHFLFQETLFSESLVFLKKFLKRIFFFFVNALSRNKEESAKSPHPLTRNPPNHSTRSRIMS